MGNGERAHTKMQLLPQSVRAILLLWTLTVTASDKGWATIGKLGEEGAGLWGFSFQSSTEAEANTVHLHRVLQVLRSMELQEAQALLSLGGWPASASCPRAHQRSSWSGRLQCIFTVTETCCTEAVLQSPEFYPTLMLEKWHRCQWPHVITRPLIIALATIALVSSDWIEYFVSFSYLACLGSSAPSHHIK